MAFVGNVNQKSTIEKGIEIVAGIGEPLLNLAKGVQAMADLKFPIYDKDGNIIRYKTRFVTPFELIFNLLLNHGL